MSEKRLLLGDEAVALGALHAGLSGVYAYPGTPSTEVTEFIQANAPEVRSRWCTNEKTAMEAALGMSYAGKRALVCMKHVGMNVCADAFVNSAVTGVNGGLVVLAADDPSMHSSQNEQDSRHYAIGAKLPMLEPSDSAEALQFAKDAFEISEKYDTPVLLRMCTRVSHSQSIVETGDRVIRKKIPYEKKASKYIMMPGYAKLRHPIVEERTRKLEELAEDCPYNRVEWGGRDIGIITSGTSYQYVKEVFGDSASVLKIGMPNPLPAKLITDFASNVETLYVIEELDPVIENFCRTLGLDPVGKEKFSIIGEFSQRTIAEAFGLDPKETVKADTQPPARPPVMCSGCPHRGMYYVLAKNKITVLGDIGCYTLGAAPPLCALDSTLCMGASVSGIHGFLNADEAMSDKTVAVIGDSTFIHSGVTGLINIAYNGSNSTVIILDNSITGMTGHQQNPTTGYNIKGDPAGKVDLEALCKSIGIRRVRVVDPTILRPAKKSLRKNLRLRNRPS
jgi:indolepyruvate ferredoxin oxidoreductase alpha subunit